MGLFSKRSKEPDPDHPEPVEIDLGLRKEFEVEYEIERMRSDGLRLHLLAQAEDRHLGDLFPKHCRVYVHPDDAAAVREELVAIGLL